MKERFLCIECGSTEVVSDAWVKWDEDTQEWVFLVHKDPGYDLEYCHDCKEYTEIVNQEDFNWLNRTGKYGI